MAVGGRGMPQKDEGGYLMQNAAKVPGVSLLCLQQQTRPGKPEGGSRGTQTKVMENFSEA